MTDKKCDTCAHQPVPGELWGFRCYTCSDNPAVVGAKESSWEPHPTKQPKVIPVSTADSTQVGGSHYKDMGVQPWEVMEHVLTPEEFRGFLKGSIIKYSMRAGKKAESDDIGKVGHYKQKLGELMRKAVGS